MHDEFKLMHKKASTPHPARLRFAATVDPPRRSQTLAGGRVSSPALDRPSVGWLLLPSPRFAQRSGGEGAGGGGASSTIIPVEPSNVTRGESCSLTRTRVCPNQLKIIPL